MPVNEIFRELIAPYEGDVASYFRTCGGHIEFLTQYADLLDAHGLTLLDEIGAFDGPRFPKEVDVGAADKKFSWFFHYHNEQKKGRGHFHLYASAPTFGDYSTVTKTHLIAIEVTETGDFSGFFVPNNWITRDHPRPAHEIAEQISQFHTNNENYATSLNIWLSAILREFEDVVVDLLQQRDTFLSQLSLPQREAYFENREVEKICERVF